MGDYKITGKAMAVLVGVVLVIVSVTDPATSLGWSLFGLFLIGAGLVT